MPVRYKARNTELFFQVTNGLAPRSGGQFDEPANQRRVGQIVGFDEHVLASSQFAAMVDQDLRRDETGVDHSCDKLEGK